MRALFLFTLLVFCLVGCIDVDKVVNLAANPTHVLEAFATLVTGMFFYLSFWEGQSAWPHACLNAIRYTGVVCMAVGPLFYLQTERIGPAVAMVLSGFAAVLGIKLGFSHELKQMNAVSSDSDDEDEDEDEEPEEESPPQKAKSRRKAS